MNDMPVQPLARLLMVAGVVLFVVGLALWLGAGKLPLGRLPGDIAVRRPGFSFYFPLASSLLVSLLLTLALWLWRKFGG